MERSPSPVKPVVPVAHEFSIDNGGSWQTSGSYTGLAANTSYQVRVKGCQWLYFASLPVVVGTSPIVYTINATAGSKWFDQSGRSFQCRLRHQSKLHHHARQLLSN